MKRSGRHVKGSNLIDLIKLTKELQKRGATWTLSAPTEALLAGRVLSSDWYALEPFLELLGAVDSFMLRADEQRALEMGAAGGVAALRGPAKLYLRENDPQKSVYAMRHAWRARFDFGELTAEMEGERAIRFTLTGYDDISMVHALTTAGWGVAAARVAGSTRAAHEVLERPWRGGASFSYRIYF